MSKRTIIINGIERDHTAPVSNIVNRLRGVGLATIKSPFGRSQIVEINWTKLDDYDLLFVRNIGKKSVAILSQWRNEEGHPQKKRCPFCGGTVLRYLNWFLDTVEKETDALYVKCSNCCAQAPVEVWDKRY